MASCKHTDLKYLGFFEVWTGNATKCAAHFYGLAKESVGPFKPSVEGVETTVKIIVGPVYEKVEGKPHEFFVFLEKKVDDVVGCIDCKLCKPLKEMSSQCCQVAHQVPEKVKSVLEELHTQGVMETAHSCCVTCRPVAEKWTCAAWKTFLKVPGVCSAVHFVAPATLFCAEKFNDVAVTMKEMRVPLSGFIPVLPIETLEKAMVGPVH